MIRWRSFGGDLCPEVVAGHSVYETCCWWLFYHSQQFHTICSPAPIDPTVQRSRTYNSLALARSFRSVNSTKIRFSDNTPETRHIQQPLTTQESPLYMDSRVTKAPSQLLLRLSQRPRRSEPPPPPTNKAWISLRVCKFVVWFLHFYDDRYDNKRLGMGQPHQFAQEEEEAETSPVVSRIM